MSLFQCDRCGCLENTACTGGYWAGYHRVPEEAAESYRKVLGLEPGEKLGSYCSACDPQWFTPDGREYGVGPRPEGYKDRLGMGHHEGKWHGRFERCFYPKGKFHTNGDGNLAHVDTFETDIEKYRLPFEDHSVHHTWHDTNMRLPRPSELREKKRGKKR